MAAFATEAQFKERYDSRTINQLTKDDNTTTGDSAVITALLDDASAEITAAAIQGSQYTRSQLDTLVSSGDTMLVRLACDIAMRNLFRRRGQGVPPQFADSIRSAEDFIDTIKKGGRVLSVDDNRPADVPSLVELSASEKQNLGLIVDRSPFWGGAKPTPNTNG